MKGICFKEPLFKAVINGTKTQTRWLMNPQPYLKGIDEKQWVYELNLRPNELCGRFKPCYKIGKKVYLKEPYCVEIASNITYKYLLRRLAESECKKIKWQNKLFMPEKYARYFIEITAVRCERLQDIRYEDCLKEGIKKHYAGNCEKCRHFRGPDNPFCRDCEDEYNYSNGNGDTYFRNAQQAFAALINKIYGKCTWETNPYVWVYDFKLCNK